MQKNSGLSWLGFVNIVFFQWLCVRLAQIVEPGDVPVGWCIIGPVLPLTGWWSDYIGRPRSIVILSQRDPTCKDANDDPTESRN